MSVLILSLFNGILLFRQRTEQSVLYHVCPDAEGLGGTLNSALLKVGLAKKEMPCRLLVVFREIQCVSRSQCRLLNFIQFSASDGEGNGGVIQHILKGTVPSHIEIPFQNSIGSLPVSVDNRLNFPVSNSPADLTCVTFSNSLAYGSSSLK